MSGLSVSRVRAVLWKEWLELRRNRGALGPTLLLPIIMTGVAIATLSTISSHLPKVDSTLKLAEQRALLMQVGRQMVTLFLIMPCILPSTSAAHSIVGEKNLRSLEPVLASPVRTVELLGGKILLCVMLGVIPAWTSYSAFLTILHTRLPHEIWSQLVMPTQLAMVLLLGPLLALASVSATTIVSSRLSDVQAAQSVSVLVVLPIIGLAMSQAAGLIMLPISAVFIAAAVLCCIDIALIALCVRVFDRETILTRWK